jgi:hypothetical protein
VDTPPKNGCFTARYYITLHTLDWDRSDIAEDRRMLAESLKEASTDFGQNSQRIFSDHAPASIDYAVIVSNIYEATDDQRGNESMMGVPIRCYLATATQAHRKAWQQSNTSFDVHGTPLTWTKITGIIQPGLSPSGQVHGQINPLGAGRPVLFDFGYYVLRRSSLAAEAPW